MGGTEMDAVAVGGEATFRREVIGRLNRLGRRLRAYAVADGLAALFLFGLGAASVQLFLDYTLRMRRDMRAALLAVIAAIAAVLLWRRVWRPLRLRYGARDMASLIEKRHPGLSSALVSAVQFESGEVGAAESNSRELMGAVLDRAREASRSLPMEAILEHGRARRSALALIGVMAAGAAAALVNPEVMGMWLDRSVLLSSREWPKRTRLVVESEKGVLHGARGDDLEVRGYAEGEAPREVTILFEPESGEAGRETMTAVGARGFRYTFARVEEPFRFKLRGGDDETEWFEALLADRPRVEELTLSVTPPAYSGIEPYVLDRDERSVETLKGSEVRIEIRSNKPVAHAELMAGQEAVGAAEGSGDRWSIVVRPAATQTYHFALEDELGLEDKRPMRLAVRVLKDDAPRVRMDVRGASDMVTPQAVLPIDLSFADEYGLARAAVVHQVGREGYVAEEWPLRGFVERATRFDTRVEWPVAPLGLVPGDRVSLYAEGEDYDDVSGPNRSQSATAMYRVVSTDELLAELARREQEYRQEFERVIEQQEDLRGEMLSLIRQTDGPDASRDLANRTAPFERRQRQMASQVNLLRQQFELILEETVINGLDSVAVRERLGEGIVEPLDQLAKRDLIEAADLIREFGRSAGLEVGSRAATADRAQDAILRRMREILANMLKWEGYQEAVTMLRDILRLQGQLSDETQEEMERRAAELLRGG